MRLCYTFMRDADAAASGAVGGCVCSYGEKERHSHCVHVYMLPIKGDNPVCSVIETSSVSVCVCRSM